ncbi:TonB-dependent receptor [Allomuricauda sp. F6463D]|uniref:TonB-dependent receptor n=1 Tax=Allomuricauda sp. F6463D TaxID=2926409 RepID=UPI001FF48A54|nr:TonB-dependent receptor [Muricauda sp. F6463D]MCK0159997.1 TonB-dependent receptor [Muricauda sp. F6463D]
MTNPLTNQRFGIWHTFHIHEIAISLFLFMLSLGSFAQDHTGTTLRGQLLNENDSTPIAYATVLEVNSGTFAYTDEFGAFTLTGLASKPVHLQFSCLGYQTRDMLFEITSQKHQFFLKEATFNLDDVVVVGKEVKTGSSTIIGKKAIEHTQAVSLNDIFQLLPGQLAINPSFSSPQQLTLRQGSSLSAANKANALGTQIVSDGIPQSNNADLQTDVSILNSSPGSDPLFSTVAGKGTDLREWSADNIESVEVIRGIPSAKYGDLTSGLVLVNSRIGAFDPEFILRLNPNLAQVSFNFGKNLNKKNSLSAGADWLESSGDLRNSTSSYQRFNGQLAWQRRGSFLKIRQIGNVSYSYDKYQGESTTEALSYSEYSSQNWRFKWNSEISLATPGKTLKAASIKTGVSYASQESYYQDLITRDLYPISVATTDTTMVGQYGRSEYLNQTTIDGNPLNIYNRIEGVWSFNGLWGDHHRLTGGTEFRYDENFGNGRQFDPLTPPRQNYSMGDRPDSWDEIPGKNQLGVYLEDRIHATLFSKEVVLSMGVRWDRVSTDKLFNGNVGDLVSPRINMNWSVHNNLSLRMGWGKASKSPTLSQLYPGKRYFDLVNFNYFANDPAERLVVITTKVIDLNDQPLRPYTMNKWEGGFTFTDAEWDITGTAFYEKTDNAISYVRQVTPMEYDKYVIDYTSEGQPPVLMEEPASTETFFAGVDVPQNNLTIINKGFEYTVASPRWDAINTEVLMNGAWYFTTSQNHGQIAESSFVYANAASPTRIPLYEKTGNVVSERLNSSLRTVTHIPQIGFVVSALWQAVWIDKSKSGALSPYPTGFVNTDGEVVALTSEQAISEEFSDLHRVVSERKWNKYPSLHLFNIKVTKEWKDKSRFSFYANNIFNHRPLHWNDASEIFVRRNPSTTFGLEIIYKIN